MRVVGTLSTGLLLVVLVGTAAGDDDIPLARAKPDGRVAPLVAESQIILVQAVEPKQKDQPKDKEKPKGKELPPQATPPAPVPDDLFANAPAPGGEAPVGLSPHMIGDFPGFLSRQNVVLPSYTVLQTFQNIIVGYKSVQLPGSDFPTLVPILAKVPVTTIVPVRVSTTAPVALAFGGGLKVAENQSPLPTDRAYLTYNYYNNLGISSPGQVSTQSFTYNGFPATATTVIPGSPRGDLHRETFGFEKTFLDGAGSIGMRLPFNQFQGDGSIGQQDLGDMSWLVNYAFYRGTTTGSVLSGGLMATLPTGPPQYSVVGNIHPAIMQPFFGYRWVVDRVYLQGFSSTAVPTDPRFVTAMFNDLSAGYWLYRSPRRDLLVTALIPTIEVHVTTPLNHRGPDNVVYVPDIVALTAGVQIGLRNRAMLTLGVVVPVTGPQVFPVEAIAQFNWRY